MYRPVSSCELLHPVQEVREGFNYGLFLPPCNGRAGKFLLEERAFRDYPFQVCHSFILVGF